MLRPLRPLVCQVSTQEDDGRVNTVTGKEDRNSKPCTHQTSLGSSLFDTGLLDNGKSQEIVVVES